MAELTHAQTGMALWQYVVIVWQYVAAAAAPAEVRQLTCIIHSSNDLMLYMGKSYLICNN